VTQAVSSRIVDQLPTRTPDGRPYKFLFICGHMRSGTNWLCNIMRGHRDVSVHGEGPFGLFGGAVVEAKRLRWLYSSRDPGIKQVLDESLADLVRNCMLQLATIEPGKSWVVESTSRQLWPYIPGAHHIHIQRDLRDVLTSWTFHQLRLGMPIGEPWSTRLRAQTDALARNPEHFKEHPHELFADEAWVRFATHGWVEFILTAAAVRRLAAAGTLEIKLLDIVYEDMLADTATAQRRIFTFMDLDPADAAPLSVKNRTAAGFDREDPTSHFRAGRRGDWEQYATDDFRRWVKEEAGQVLIDAGYEKDMNW
jgi:hypothetical protein